MDQAMTLRSATIDDAHLLLDWRNDPLTRSASHHMTEISMEKHLSWLTNAMNSANNKLFVAEEKGVPVGTVRADLDDGIWELSWTVAPKARERGIAKQMVALLAHQISDPIRAEIKAGNTASARIAEHAGMVFDKEIQGILHYRRSALK